MKQAAEHILDTLMLWAFVMIAFWPEISVVGIGALATVLVGWAHR